MTGSANTIRKKAIVVGSGAGGCAAAAKLSECFDVTVLEAGNAFAPFAMNLSRMEPLRRAGLMVDERMITRLFPAMQVLKAREGLVHVQGRCVGGSTALATGNALRCDGGLRRIGLDLDAEFDELAGLVPIDYSHHEQFSDLTVRLFMAFEELGFDPQVTPKFLKDPWQCTTCGRCVLGCRFGAKWTADMLLADRPDIEVLTGCSVKRVVVEGGRARGVEFARAKGPLGMQGSKRTQPAQTMEADVVVLAAGGLGTPVVLANSGFDTRPTLFDDPVICVAAPWKGASLDAQMPMPFVSQRDGYILSPYFDWLSFFFNKSWRAGAHDIMSIMVKYADSCQGSYDGKVLSKPTTPDDEEVVARSVEEASQVLERMGVARDQMFLGTLNAGHPGGCLPLTPAEASTLHHAQLPCNLYVADASLLPESMGNPPILTIMALAMRVARACNEALAG